uniref:Uncharacterized protein n=1 Tax=Arundo donax TaxID=35708 RepID=A0A0A8ZET1_ARUDO
MPSASLIQSKGPRWNISNTFSWKSSPMQPGKSGSNAMQKSSEQLTPPFSLGRSALYIL